MHLKSLTLRGFKSFAKTTTFRFEPGITCVVGPNGSGKSNVVDALSWVMGEQGAKTLRGTNMSDVIFAGSTDRAALGRAFVELTIDNTDGALPIDYSEVTISRTLFRGGGSEYAINGTSARLLDVQELLSDTGMGKQMHVIVGQGQLDAVLRATPEERRSFIDEAAGVLKHRRRKERAVRKLDAMGQNLVRVADLTEEIRRQLKPLARQAKAAEAAGAVQAEIDAAASRITAEDIVLARERVAKEEKAVESLRTQLRAGDSELSQVEAQWKEHETEHRGHVDKARTFGELAHQLDAQRERFSSIVGIATERMTFSAPLVVVSPAQIELAREAAAQARTDSQKADAELEKWQETLADLQEQRRVATIAERDARDALHRREAELAQVQKTASDAHQALAQAQSRVEDAVSAAERAESEVVAAKKALTDTPVPKPVESAIDNAPTRAFEEATARESDARTALAQAQENERSALAEVATWEARKEALRPPPIPSTHDSQWEPRSSLERQLVVESGWERAIAALLGGFDAAIVVTDADSIDAGLAWAARQDLALRAVVSDSSDGIDSDTIPSPAAQLITPEPAVRAAIAELLAGCAVAEDRDSALALLDEPGVDRVATRDGVVFTHHTIAGPSTNAQPQLLQHAQWREACLHYESAAATLTEAQTLVDARRESLRQASRLREETLENLRAADRQLAEATRLHAESLARREANEGRLARAIDEKEKRQHAVEQAREALIRAQEAASSAPEITAGDFLSESRRLAEQRVAELQKIRENELSAQSEVRRCEIAVEAAQRAVRGFDQRVSHLELERRQSLEAESLRSRRIHTLSGVRDRAEAARVRCAELHARAASLRDASEAEAARLAQTINDSRQRLEDIRVKLSRAADLRHQGEVALAQATMVRDEAEKRGRELCEDIEVLIATHGPHVPVVDAEGHNHPYSRTETLETLEAAQRKLARLGVVNPLAVEEHRALAERLAFLEEQMADLENSKTDLLRIIRDVDRQIQETFQEAFADTVEQFRHVFATLFPGGKGDLRLTDPDDPLHTGVEIYARPAGKRVTQLSLLSGGERSLAALAYLVAIFQARPSPFYVMDEVEAALDDINLSRVLTSFEELRESSQLILITHQKRTMEIADALYGVTMRDGVSQVISHRIAG